MEIVKNAWHLSKAIARHEIEQLHAAGIEVEIDEDLLDIATINSSPTIIKVVSVKIYTYTEQQDLVLRLMFGEYLVRGFC